MKTTKQKGLDVDSCGHRGDHEWTVGPHGEECRWCAIRPSWPKASKPCSGAAMRNQAEQATGRARSRQKASAA